MRSTSATVSEAVLAAGSPAVAWGGNAEWKKASIKALQAGLAARPKVTCIVDLFLGSPETDEYGSLYCSAYGTADPRELEARSGLPVWVLQLVSGVLSVCQIWVAGRPQLIASAADMPRAALEAIPVGADLQSIARRYSVLMLDWCAALRDSGGCGLSAEQQSLVREVRALHAADCNDAAAFRALRRRVMAATDAAHDGINSIVLRFVESVAWPTAGQLAELPEIVSRAHHGLRECLAPERPSPEMLATPESKSVNSPEFQSRLEHYMRVEVESYAPLALGMLLEALRSG